jgi:hypothetical protein
MFETPDDQAKQSCAKRSGQNRRAFYIDFQVVVMP